jgi:hypothetical protein
VDLLKAAEELEFGLLNTKEKPTERDKLDVVLGKRRGGGGVLRGKRGRQKGVPLSSASRQTALSND